MWVYLNDRIVNEDEARISVFDRGFLYGDGVFETVRIYDGFPVWLARHLARLTRSCRAMPPGLLLPEKNWPDVFQQVIDRNRLHHGVIRLTLSRGSPSPSPLPLGEGQGEGEATPTVVLFPRPLPHVTPQQRRNGVSITLLRMPLLRAHPPQAKTLNYLNNLLAKQEASERGAFEGLLLNVDGHLAECAMSNVFFIQRDVLHTPSLECGALPGVTRGVILEAAPTLGLQTQEGRYTPDVLHEADECFLTSSGIGILPVANVDGRPFPRNPAGSWVEILQHHYDRMLREQSRRNGTAT